MIALYACYDKEGQVDPAAVKKLVRHYANIVVKGIHPERMRGTVRLSEDGGKTWAYSKVVQPGDFWYSCLTVAGDIQTSERSHRCDRARLARRGSNRRCRFYLSSDRRRHGCRFLCERIGKQYQYGMGGQVKTVRMETIVTGRIRCLTIS